MGECEQVDQQRWQETRGADGQAEAARITQLRPILAESKTNKVEILALLDVPSAHLPLPSYRQSR